MVVPTRPCQDRVSPRLLGERSPAVRAKTIQRLIEALKSELEVYGCAIEALPGEGPSSLAWREVSRSHWTPIHWRKITAQDMVGRY